MSYRPKVCVDTSALVKWFKDEKERLEAIKLKNWAEEGKIKLVHLGLNKPNFKQ